ncbi:MAG: sulfite exporter TauE/SafE family protein [Planctomycetes bacterium]|nr:sulfite exporter TauE/SafE family protein [Planctomycetota bacterium]
MTLLWVLALAAFATSIISGIIGMGGGILLLATMLSFLSHAETIPAHGAVQLVSNGTRLLVFLRHIDVKTVLRFAAGALPGSIIGGLLLVWLRKDHIDSTEPYFKIAIGLYVLITTFRPIAKRPASNESAAPRISTFTLLGGLAGVLGLTIGAIGPLIAPAFLHAGFVKERMIATKAVCQMIIHLLKVPIFLASGLVDYTKLGQLIVVMSLMVIPGTLIGKKILKRVDERAFVILFKLAMLLAGLKVLMYDGFYKLLTAAN